MTYLVHLAEYWPLYILTAVCIFVCLFLPIKGLVDDLWKPILNKKE